MAARDNTKAALARTRDTTRTEQPFNTSASAGTGKGRITVDLSPDLYRKFKAGAAWHDRMMNEIIRELVAAWVADHPMVD